MKIYNSQFISGESKDFTKKSLDLSLFYIAKKIKQNISKIRFWIIYDPFMYLKKSQKVVYVTDCWSEDLLLVRLKFILFVCLK